MRIVWFVSCVIVSYESYEIVNRLSRIVYVCTNQSCESCHVRIVESIIWVVSCTYGLMDRMGHTIYVCTVKVCIIGMYRSVHTYKVGFIWWTDILRTTHSPDLWYVEWGDHRRKTKDEDIRNHGKWPRRRRTCRLWSTQPSGFVRASAELIVPLMNCILM